MLFHPRSLVPIYKTPLAIEQLCQENFPIPTVVAETAGLSRALAASRNAAPIGPGCLEAVHSDPQQSMGGTV